MVPLVAAGLFCLAVALWVVGYAISASRPPVERVDDAILDAIARLRTPIAVMPLSCLIRGWWWGRSASAPRPVPRFGVV